MDEKIDAAKAVQFNAISEVPEELGLPYSYYKRLQTDINTAINEFNAAQEPEAKKAALLKMQHAVDYVDVHLPSDDLANAIEFHEFKKHLFNKVKKAFAENGVNTLLKPGSADTPIARILSDMSPDKADRLMEILHQGEKDMEGIHEALIQKNLSNLYDSNDTSAEAKQWRIFFNTHKITFLGGGNSRNYTVKNIEPTDPHYGSAKVLKIDNRLGLPRHAEHHLRNALGDVFAPIDATRQVRGNDNEGALVSRTLLVTDLCTSGSVDEHALKARIKGETETLRQCGHIMGQMAQVFMDIQKANCCFPDSKLSNWLVDKEGKIHLSDSKSFVFTQNGLYRSGIPGNEYLDIVSSPGYEPKDLDAPSFHVEQLHASLLGRNIYAYLTGAPPPDKLFFAQPIFQTPIGQLYQQLITQLIQDPPRLRMSLSDAYEKLKELTWAAEYQDVCDKALKLSHELNIPIQPLVDPMINVDDVAGADHIMATMQRVNGSLDKLVESSNKCNQLIQDINDFTINGKPLIPMDELIQERNQMTRGAVSIDYLKNKLDSFCPTLEHYKAQLTEYKTLYDNIALLKISKNDKEMDKFLTACHLAVTKDENRDELLQNLSAQIEKMRTIHEGLTSPANKEVLNIAHTHEKRERWHNIGMEKKARRIEKALESVPIEERAQLLQSKHPSVTTVLGAIATRRKEMFTKAINEEGKIVVDNSAKVFKAFQEKFKEQMAQRDDVEFGKEHHNTPKH